MLINKCHVTSIPDDGIPFEVVSDTQAREIASFKERLVSGFYRRVELEECPLCKAQNAFLIAEKDCYSISLKTVVCEGCGLVRSYDPLDEASFIRFYQDQYRAMCETASDRLETEIEKRFSRDLHGFMARHFGAQLRLDSNSLVIEVGAGGGWNLHSFHKSGIPVMGCDFDQQYLEFGKAKGINLIRGSVGDLEAAGYRADLVLLVHVVEHFTDPIDSLRKIRGIMKENAYLYIGTPGLRSLRFGAANGSIQGRLQIPHTFFFELCTLNACLQKAGFEPVYGDEWINSLCQKKSVSAPTAISLKGRGAKVVSFIATLKYSRRFWDFVFRVIGGDYLSRRGSAICRLAYGVAYPEWVYRRVSDRFLSKRG